MQAQFRYSQPIGIVQIYISYIKRQAVALRVQRSEVRILSGTLFNPPNDGAPGEHNLSTIDFALWLIAFIPVYGNARAVRSQFGGRLFESGQGHVLQFSDSFACPRDRYLVEREPALPYS